MEVQAAGDENVFHACTSQILQGSALFDKELGIAGEIQSMKHFFTTPKALNQTGYGNWSQELAWIHF